MASMSKQGWHSQTAEKFFVQGSRECRDWGRDLGGDWNPSRNASSAEIRVVDIQTVAELCKWSSLSFTLVILLSGPLTSQAK